MSRHGASRRTFLLGGAGGAALLLGPGAASARAGPAALPDVIDCDGWGARPSSGVVPVLARRPAQIIVHHTADPNGGDHSRAAAERIARAIQDFHMDRRGWIDSGQHFTISRGGYVLEGRRHSLEALLSGRRHVVGAHCTGQNEVAVGIENEGTYGRVAPPEEQLTRLRALCAAICARYGIAATEIRGHRDYRDTACPGDRLYGLLPQLRVDVASLLGVRLAVGSAVHPTWPLLRLGDQGPSVLTAQHLLRAAGRAEVHPDGEFGPGMEQSVRGFQADRGTEEVNGLIGGETWPLLTRDVRVDGDGHGARAVRMLRSGTSPAVDAPPDAAEWQRMLGAVG